MAICIRRDCTDHLDIFTTKDWRLLQTFPTNLEDLVDIAWLKKDTAIVCWDNPSASYRVSVYSPTGEEMST